MHDRSRKKHPSDLNQLAAAIVDAAANGEKDELEELMERTGAEGKDPAAVALGHRGGKKGGPARAKKLTPERRKEIARRAAEARWKKKM